MGVPSVLSVTYGSHPDSALHCYACMPAARLAADAIKDDHGVSTFNLRKLTAAITAHGRRLAWTAALDALLLARKRSAELNIIPFTATVRACGSAQRWSSSLRLLETLNADALKADVILYSSVLGTFCVSGDCSASFVQSTWLFACRWLGQMARREVHPDPMAYNCAISALLTARRSAEACG